MDDTIKATTSKSFSIKSCVLSGIMIILGLRGFLMAISILLLGYVFIKSGMMNRTSILFFTLSSLQCMLILFLAFRIHKQRWFISLGLFACVIILSIFTPSINDSTARIRFESISMKPTIVPGDYFYVDKLVYRAAGSPQRGDVIMFRYPPNPDETPYIKRIIGLPGDQVHIADGEISINNQLMDEPYLTDKTKRGGDWTVPAGNFFVLGDNRNNSSDSRTWGFVPFENIIGKVTYIYFPLSRAGRVVNPFITP